MARSACAALALLGAVVGRAAIQTVLSHILEGQFGVGAITAAQATTVLRIRDAIEELIHGEF